MDEFFVIIHRYVNNCINIMNIVTSLPLLGRPPWPYMFIIIGWCSSNPITAATRSLDSVPLYFSLILFPSVRISLLPLAPHGYIPPGPSPSLSSACSLSPPMVSPPSPLVVYCTGHHQWRWSPAFRLYTFPTDCQTIPFRPWIPAQRPDAWRFVLPDLCVW